MKKVIQLECCICGSSVSSTTFCESVGVSRSYRPNVELCELCYTTTAGNVLIYDQDPYLKESVKASVQIGNLILERMKHGSDFKWVSADEEIEEALKDG